ncbi:hypothetical protein DXG01_004506 [Tephrocybe rancida]|nr:hypothetical protein DXG01_004506 [Tephrocybe rancida]
MKIREALLTNQAPIGVPEQTDISDMIPPSQALVDNIKAILTTVADIREEMSGRSNMVVSHVIGVSHLENDNHRSDDNESSPIVDAILEMNSSDNASWQDRVGFEKKNLLPSVVLHGWDELVTALPLLVFGDASNIQCLISSVLYQRHAWGIDAPLIAFTDANSGACLQVLVAWLDTKQTQNDLPAVCVADCNSIESLDLGDGLDLAEPSSAIRFAHFIFGLTDHFDDISRQASIFSSAPSSAWRYHQTQEERNNRVAAWVSDTIPDPLPQSDLGEEYITSVKSAYKDDIVIIQTICEPSPFMNISGHTKARYVIEAMELTKALLPSSKPKPAPRPRYNGPISSISTFMLERRALSLSLYEPAVEFPGWAARVAEINDVRRLYKELTQHAWPVHWKTLTDLPFASEALYKDHCETLLSHHMHLIAEAEAVVDLEQDVAEAISEEFNVVLDISAEVKRLSTHVRYTGGIVVDHFWNTLFYRFFRSSHRPSVSPDIVFGRTINYPKNSLFERMLTQSIDAVSGEMNEFTMVKLDLSLRQAFIDCPELTQGALQDAAHKAFEIVPKLKGMAGEDFLADHADTEPETGTVDVVLGIAFTKHCDGPGLAELHDLVDSKAFLRTEHSSHLRSFTTAGSPLAHDGSGRGVRHDDASRSAALWLPIAVVQHTKLGQSKRHAKNLVRMHSIAAVTFLHILGIKDQPVVGLVTHGTKVTIMLTWKSEVKEEASVPSTAASRKIMIFDSHNVETFDIAKPLGCYRFCVLLLRLSRRARELKEVVRKGGHAGRFFEQADSSFENWTVKSLKAWFDLLFENPQSL